MSNIKILSVGSRDCGVEVFRNINEYVTITASSGYDFIPIELDISSAILFSKQLRKVIAEVKSAEK